MKRRLIRERRLVCDAGIVSRGGRFFLEAMAGSRAGGGLFLVQRLFLEAGKFVAREVWRRGEKWKPAKPLIDNTGKEDHSLRNFSNQSDVASRFRGPFRVKWTSYLFKSVSVSRAVALRSPSHVLPWPRAHGSDQPYPTCSPGMLTHL